jgi:hypothetical protein
MKKLNWEKKKIKEKYHFRVSLIFFFFILLCKQLEKKILKKKCQWERKNEYLEVW